MKLNKAGLELIKDFEGLRLEAYKCPAGVWTIGYGHTGKVKQGDKITEKKAEELLLEDLADSEAAVKKGVKAKINDSQYSALVSFTFNLGAGAFAGSTLLKKVNAGNMTGAANEFPKWRHARGKVLKGLVRRRAAERALFESK